MSRWKEPILSVLAGSERPLTTREIAERIGAPHPSYIQGVLGTLVGERLVRGRKEEFPGPERSYRPIGRVRCMVWFLREDAKSAA